MNTWAPDTPIYRQIELRLEDEILGGVIKEGELLPSVRQVAASSQVNPLTVARAYQGLADRGLADKHRGVGMRVAPGARERLLKRSRDEFLTEQWPAIVDRMRLLGLSPTDAVCRQIVDRLGKSNG